jgi:hypothetical protein
MRLSRIPGLRRPPVFSLQALAGVALTDTMQLQVTLGATSIVAMLDSGSTHNFISEAATARTGLPLEHRPRLTTMVANGEHVACVGVIRNAPLDIGGHCFPADLYVMPLAGYDVVLGTRWLAALGPIMWDFSNHAISFTFQGRAFCWQPGRGSRPADRLLSAQPPPPVRSSTSSWRTSMTFSASLAAYLPHAVGTIASPWCRGHRQWQYAHIATPPCTRTNWSVSAQLCWTRGSFGAAAPHFRLRCSWSRNQTARGGSASTTAR